MTTSRRDLLKYFGIGATIIPVIGGAPRMEMPAKLIREPQFDPIEVIPAATPLNELANSPQAGKITVLYTANDKSYRFDADVFGLDLRMDVREVRSRHTQFVDAYVGHHELTWELKGHAANAMATRIDFMPSR